MPTRLRAALTACCFCVLLLVPVGAQPGTARNLVLITLDGTRTQEIFGGLDRDALKSSLDKDAKLEETRAYKRYWAATPEARRAKVMPFFWTEWMGSHGSIAGNRARGSKFGITNGMRFSYPGYAEILTGEAHDTVIDSNDNRRYPFPTVLDVLKRRLSLSREQVAAFGSWETFRWITSNQEDAFVVNAGYQPFDDPRPEVRLLSRWQFETQTGWDSVRNDMYTFRLALAHLQAARPRVLYLALGETDDWAHEGRYDRVLQTLELTDGWFKELWTWLQSDPQYKDNTAILITVDHGRGRTASDWGKHGKKVDGAQETWLAAIGPDWPRRGEWANAPDAFTNQIAATGARVLGVNLREDIPNAGGPIEYLWSR